MISELYGRIRSESNRLGIKGIYEHTSQGCPLVIAIEADCLNKNTPQYRLLDSTMNRRDTLFIHMPDGTTDDDAVFNLWFKSNIPKGDKPILDEIVETVKESLNGKVQARPMTYITATPNGSMIATEKPEEVDAPSLVYLLLSRQYPEVIQGLKERNIPFWHLLI